MGEGSPRDESGRIEAKTEGAGELMKSCFLIHFDTDEPVSVDDRLSLKDWFGSITRAALRSDAVVAVDHLDADEPTVRALLVD